MSRIGNLNLELQNQANKLGYSTVQEAIDDGYTITYTDQRLVKDMSKEYEKAHKAWVEEKSRTLVELYGVIHFLELIESTTNNSYKPEKDAIKRAINFIKKGEV